MIKTFQYIAITSLISFSNSDAADLIITIDNIQSTLGSIKVALYTDENSFPNESKHSHALVIPIPGQQGTVTATFLDLDAGEYAVALYQDENNNDKLDTNLFGIPKEPYGFNHKGTGIPDFSEASTLIADNNINLTIKLR